MNKQVERRIKEELVKEFEGNVWRPDYLNEIDSDPRYRALDLIEEIENVTIEWAWVDTDFTSINGEPIVVEFSSTSEDKIKQGQGLEIIKKICGEDYKIIEGPGLIIILNRKEK